MADTMSENILIICPTSRDFRELKSFTNNYSIYFHDYDKNILDGVLDGYVENPPASFEPEKKLNELLEFCIKNSITAVASTNDYPGPIYSSVISKKLGLRGPDPMSVLTCQHKFYSRLMQKKWVPHASPEFRLIDPKQFQKNKLNLNLPIFVKPVKSYLSKLAQKITSHAELEKFVQSSLPPDLFLEQLNWFLKNHSSYELNANYLIAESLLTGTQVTLEGYVFDGKVNILGIVDSVMFPGTICFERFDYPSNLPKEVQQRMHDIATQFVKGIQFDYSLFNVEFMYNPSSQDIFIIEINSRMCSQFADLFEKVDGTNTYQIMLDIALGKRPTFTKLKGNHKVASSFVLRRFDNKKVIKIPTRNDITSFFNLFPDARLELHANEGQWLSSISQDGKSFRYGLIHLGAQSKEALFSYFEQSKQLLPFVFGH